MFSKALHWCFRLFIVFLKYLKSFIRDDLDMLNHHSKTNIKQSNHVSIIRCCELVHWHNTQCSYTFRLEKRNNHNSLTAALTFILLYTPFLFGTVYYRQNLGISSRYRAVKLITNLVMGGLELKTKQLIRHKSGTSFHYYLPFPDILMPR